MRSRAAHLGPERRRPHVLDAALAIAVGDGVGAVSIGTVAERLRVTRPVVYSCFSDRVEMLAALIEREEGALLSGVLDALPKSAPADAGEDVFVAGFRALLHTVAQRPDAWRLLFLAAPDPDVAAHFGRARSIVAAAFADLLRPTLRAWRTKDAARKLPVLVELFMSSGESAVRSMLAPNSGWTPDDLGELIGRAVYRAFREV